jgi:hypothetical protein
MIYTPPAGGITQLTADVTAGPGSGSKAATLVATANVIGIITANAPAAVVSSVFGRVGAVTGGIGDYTVIQVTGAAPLASPAFTGVPSAPTAAALTNTTQLATTAFTTAAVGVETTRATTAEGLLAPIASPTFTGVPTGPTAVALTNTTQFATTAFTTAAVGVETTRATNAEGLLAPLTSPVLTGTPTSTTAAPGTNTAQIATTAFVTAAIAAIPAAGPLATAREVAVATSGTAVLTYTPGAARNCLLAVYFRVITATTNVTITVTWTDVTGAQSLTLINNVAEVVGSYAMNSFIIDSTAAAITITMTAGTVSQVLASATILPA